MGVMDGYGDFRRLPNAGGSEVGLIRELQWQWRSSGVNMWLSKARYEELVRDAARARVDMEELVRLQQQLIHERDRADRAIEAMLASRQLPSIQPPVETPPPAPLHEDDPAELEAWYKRYQLDPGAALREGVGEGPRE